MTRGQSTVERAKEAPQVVRGQRPRGPRFLVLSLVLLVAFALAVGVVELTLYFAGIGEEEVCIPDRELGWVHAENKRVTWRREGYCQEFFGRDGLRDPGVTRLKRPESLRVILVGDSAAESLQVPLSGTFGKIIEAKLKQKLAKDVEILNFAVLGYSQIQDALFLERILPAYRPDLVLYCYSSRDAAENIETWSPRGVRAIGNRPYAIKESGKELEISSLPVVNSLDQPETRFWSNFDWLKNNSRIWSAVAGNKPKLALSNPLVEDIARFFRNPSSLFRGIAGGATGPSFKIKFFEDSKGEASNKSSSMAARSLAAFTPAQKAMYLDTIGNTFGAVVGRMNSRCKKSGSDFAVITMPARLELIPTESKPPALFDVDYIDELGFINRACVEHAVPLLDLQTRAGSLTRSECEKMFYSMHFAPPGHEFIATQSEAFVAGLLSNK